MIKKLTDVQIVYKFMYNKWTTVNICCIFTRFSIHFAISFTSISH